MDRHFLFASCFPFASSFLFASYFPFETRKAILTAMSKEIDPTCRAYQKAIDVLGRPWTALILALLQDEPLRFGELAERARGVGAKMLSARLKELERRGVIARRVTEGPPLRVVYELTPKGRGFRHVAAALERWGRDLV